ncbi:restriction endonuclease subunit S [Sphingopyxis sp. C-1]|uniref:restriction endonuclease subunit S n=1 Tax=Sphingopyxis sp. C-1 TaxID=262667 RepID=UPI0006C187AA|nr:restriction endonuclease subunit S [Sphingopyxis sp. C-1]GAO77732.1 type I restriction-modification system, specificity subunit S [Sphingopyxis sp. C-1]
MNPALLLEHYERFADAPDAIARLRRLVLDLAVRGNVVEQDAGDEPASVLLKRVAAGKARLLDEGKASRSLGKSLNAPPHEVDARVGWVKVEAAELFPTRSGNSKLIKGKLHAEPGESRFPGYSAAGQDVWLDHWEHEGTAIILSAVGARCGKAFLAQGRWSAVANTHIVWLMPEITVPAFAMLHLNNEDFWVRNGGAQPFVKVRETLGRTFCLPPLAEQRRIVAKVDELMALCDQLEAARAEREAARDRFTLSTLAKLNTPDPETFGQDARFALANLAPLTTRPDQIKQLRQTILNLGVRGKLMEQDAADEPAAKLFQRLQSEKARLAKAGIIPRPKESARDLDFLAEALPAAWLPIALGDVCNLVTSGSRGWGEYYAESGPGFIRAQNIRFGEMRLDGLACVNPPAKSEGARTQVAKGDLLIVITGAGVTNPALLDVDLGEAYVSQHVGLVRPCDTGLSPWLLLCLMADAGGRSELTMRAYGAGKPGLNLDNIRSLSVPLPPLAEQHRIVAKVDALMALCDQLEASITTGEHIRSRLLEAVLHNALEPV